MDKATARRTQPAAPSHPDETTKVGSARPSDDDAGVRVLCVEDHAVLVEGLRAQFAINGRIRVVGHLTTAEHLLDEVARLQPDLVLMDIELPGPDIFEMADRLRRRHPALRFAFLSAHIRDGYIAAAYKSGAWGYFAKGDDLNDIVAGIAEVVRNSAGTFIMGRKVRERRRADPRRPSPSAHASPHADEPPATRLGSLSQRELDVVRLIGKGLSRVEVAKALSRSAKTIDGHQDRILKKLGIDSRANLILYAVREGLADA